MKINREKALAAFQEYTDRYDSSRDMIRLKIEHTYRVCGLCQQIARSLDLPEEEVDIAWLTGLLHDVGRFEQQNIVIGIIVVVAVLMDVIVRSGRGKSKKHKNN